MLPPSDSPSTEDRFPTFNSEHFLDIRQEASQAYREMWDEEPPESFVALELERRLESLRRRELLLQKPSLREWTLQQPEEYWRELTQSWTPKDWQQRVESGEFNTPIRA